MTIQYKILTDDLRPPLQGIRGPRYRLGKWFEEPRIGIERKNSLEGSPRTPYGLAAGPIESLLSMGVGYQGESVFTCECEGKRVEISPLRIYWERMRVLDRVDPDNIKTLASQSHKRLGFRLKECLYPVHPLKVIRDSPLTSEEEASIKQWIHVWNDVQNKAGGDQRDCIRSNVVANIIRSNVVANIGSSGVPASVWSAMWDHVWYSVARSICRSVPCSIWGGEEYDMLDCVESTARGEWTQDGPFTGLLRPGDDRWKNFVRDIHDNGEVRLWHNIWENVEASVWAYFASFFLDIKKWNYLGHRLEVNPYQSVVDLWRAGLVPSFDGETWRLHSGPAAAIIWEGNDDQRSSQLPF